MNEEQNKQTQSTVTTNQVQQNIPTQVVAPNTQPSPITPKGSKLKTFGLIFLFLLLFMVVMFLPQISSFIDSRKHQDPVIESTPSKEEVSKTRVCELNKTTEEMTNNIKLEFQYQNNALKKEKLTNTIMLQTANKEVEELRTMYFSCQAFKEQIEKNNGIKQTCTLKNNIYTITQNIDYEKLNEIVLEENIGELEGFYPEFSFNQDRKVIEKQLTEIGYVCKNKN